MAAAALATAGMRQRLNGGLQMVRQNCEHLQGANFLAKADEAPAKG